MQYLGMGCFMKRKITTPLLKEEALSLKAGDSVLITGYIYTARDAAHARMTEMLDKGLKLPFDVKNQIIYYAGPCPAAPGRVIGSCGPTTSGRMDKYAPRVISEGLVGMIGKGDRKETVVDAMRLYGAVYFAAIGGAGAVISQCVESAETVAFHDLGTEAIIKLFVRDFPAVVAIDAQGNNLYSSGR